MKRVIAPSQHQKTTKKAKVKKIVRGDHNKKELLNYTKIYILFPYRLAVRIPGFHPGGPGSTPGMEKKHFLILLRQ